MIRTSRLIVLALTMLAGPAAAQEPYPTRPVTIVNPFPPGGIADLTSRPLAAAFERTLKQAVVVVNKPGAAGAVGTQSAAVAKPDGYTLLVALVSISSTPEVDKLFGRPPIYIRDQFVPIARLNADPPILVVNGPWRSLPELMFTLARLNHGWRMRPEGPAAIPKEPREYARRIYVDSLTLSPRNLRFIVDELGPDRVMIGSDYPFDMGDPDPVGSLATAGLDDAARRLIESETAIGFLRL